MPKQIPMRKYNAKMPSKIVTNEIFDALYLDLLKESVIAFISNLGVRTNDDFFPRKPCKTANELCNDNPIESAKKHGNKITNFNIDFILF